MTILRKVVIAGGGSELAQGVLRSLISDYEVYAPTRVELDICNPDSVACYFDRHIPDVLVNCAGNLYAGNTLEIDPATWGKVVEVNLMGAFYVSQGALQANSQCKLIHVVSTAAFAAYGNWSAYCSSKAGQLTMLKCLFNEGYFCIAICPGATATKLQAKAGVTAPRPMMSVSEAVTPIVDAVNGRYSSGDIVCYRASHPVVVTRMN